MDKTIVQILWNTLIKTFSIGLFDNYIPVGLPAYITHQYQIHLSFDDLFQKHNMDISRHNADSCHCTDISEDRLDNKRRVHEQVTIHEPAIRYTHNDW